MESNPIVLVLGSAPGAVSAAQWPKFNNLSIIAINNAWRIRPDWDYLVHAGDFPVARRPLNVGPHQQVHTHHSYVRAQNQFGGFVYAGGTMAFTAGYWVLAVLRPRVLAYFACDMVYSGSNTHFYGTGTADPLRDDVTLRSLEAKSARLMVLAAQLGCACVNLSDERESRLVFPRVKFDALSEPPPVPRYEPAETKAALAEEKSLGYFVEDGEYWHHLGSFDADALVRIDRMWLRAADLKQAEIAAA